MFASIVLVVLQMAMYLTGYSDSGSLVSGYSDSGGHMPDWLQ